MRRILIVLTTALFAVCSYAQPAAHPVTGALKVQSVATDVKLTANRLSFGMDGTDLFFVADPSGLADPKALLKLLTDSGSATDSLTVWYDPETARFDRETSAPTVVVRSVEYQGKIYPADQKTAARVLPHEAPPDEVAAFDLVRGVAYASGGNREKALDLLDRAIAAPAFPQGLQVLGYVTRARARRELAIMDVEPGEGRDRLMIGALEDDRRVRAALPILAGPAYDVARDWKILGAYDEAVSAYQDALRRWPEQPGSAVYGLTLLYRAMGQYDKALAWSDTWGALPGAKDGMPYHYHRGWILDLMGRHDEAVAELAKGLAFQTDFIGAYWRRACANAAAGHIQDALTDSEKVIALEQEERRGAQPTQYALAMAKRYGEVREALKKALAEDPHKPLAGQCDGFWDWGDNPRSRSALLPPR